MKKVLIVFLFTLFVCSSTAFAGKDDVIATVEKQKITNEDLQNRIANYPTEYRNVFNDKNNKLKLLNQMIEELVLVEYAKDLGYEKKEDYKNYIENAQKQILLALFLKDKVESNINIPETEIKNYYQSNPEEFQAVEQRKVSQIVVKNDKTAKQVMAELKKGKAFAVVAKEKSIDPNAVRGGFIGWIPKNSPAVLPDLEKVIFSTPKGKYSNPVKTQFGYHIVYVADIAVKKKVTYDEVKDKIENFLKLQKQKQILDQILSNLDNKYKITRNIGRID